MSTSAEAFPLYWPDGWPRTQRRGSSPYSVTAGVARADLERELRLLGATGVVISSNVPLRNDGKPYAGAMDRRYDDPGVAVYFTRRVASRDPQRQVIACDKWATVDANVRAIGLAVAGLRAVQRSGASDLLDRAFTGFKALPQSAGPSSGPLWWDVLGVSQAADTEVIKARYRVLAREHHPDRNGGDIGPMATINRAYEQFEKERGL